jgi:hypothetical protein
MLNIFAALDESGCQTDRTDIQLDFERLFFLTEIGHEVGFFYSVLTEILHQLQQPPVVKTTVS